MSNRVAITGLSCYVPVNHSTALDLQGFWQNLIYQTYKNTELEQLADSMILTLAKTALDEPNEIKPRVALVLIDIESKQNDLLKSAAKLSASLGCNPPKLVNQLADGLRTAIDQIISQLVDVCLVIMIDQHSAAAFVFKNLETAIKQNDRIYAIPHWFNDQPKTEYTVLKNLYGKENKSLDLLAIAAPLDIDEPTNINRLADCVSIDSRKVKTCSLRQQSDTQVVASFLELILSLQQKILLPALPQQTAGLPAPFYINASLRPWFYPQVHKHLAQINQDLIPQSNLTNLRRAALHFIDSKEQFTHLLLEEYSDVTELQSKDLKAIWESEIFTLCAQDKKQLFNYVQAIKKYTSVNPVTTLKDIAFTVNKWANQQIDKTASANNRGVKTAFVCRSIEEMHEKLDQLSKHCLNNETTDLYWNDHSSTTSEISAGQLAFVLPGLGAAYPDMLNELCLHFPEVRAIFDFVDHIAANSPIKPSERIFPRKDQLSQTSTESAATLAMMDSAVVTVLMAEWVLFTLLLNLGITPDILLGCSTGEFAAITMSGAIDILAAAPLFYHLSTGITKALPFNRLINLRSLRIVADFTEVEEYLNQYQNKIFLSADLSSKQLLITGDKDSINELVKILEGKQIVADFLPFAIPYHTSLVADIVSPQDPDVLALKIEQPIIESWSCSLNNKLPSNPDAIRKISTELFSKPILFKNSIEALYARGVRKFVEVGPRGNLAPIVSETLQSNPHISIAANRADVSAITQINHTLAALFVHDVYINLDYLYKRRNPISLPIFDQIEDHFAQQINTKAVDKFSTFEFASINQFRKQLLDLEQKTIAALKACQAHQPLPVKWQNYINNPGLTHASEEITLTKLFKQLDPQLVSHINCRQLLETELPSDTNLLDKCADYFLTPAEMLTFQSFQQFAKRRQWLSGRLAIKEAVRTLLNSCHNSVLSNAEIEIVAKESGKIYVNKLNSTYPNPVISLSHKDGKTVAVAANHSLFSSIGIDLESNEPVDSDMANFILSATEQNYINDSPIQEQNSNFKKIWAAKEAAAKVLGFGLSNFFRTLSVSQFSADMKQLCIKAAGDNISSNPVVGTKTIQLTAYVAHLGDMIFALSFLLSKEKHDAN